MDLSKVSILEWVLGSGILSFMVKDIVLPFFKSKQESDENKLLDLKKMVDILWDSHNQKKDDSVKLKNLQDNFTIHEKKFEIFAATQQNSNSLFASQFDEIKKLIEHKENGQKNVTTGMFNALERIEDKLDSLNK